MRRIVLMRGVVYLHTVVLLTLLTPVLLAVCMPVSAATNTSAETNAGNTGANTNTGNTSTDTNASTDTNTTTETGACWGDIDPVGFTDTTELSAKSIASIACLAHYGITKGTSPTTYEPNTTITRLQMARMLVRTIAALRLTLPEGSSEPFNDLDSIDAGGRRDVARLYELGVTKGQSSRIFDPQDKVNRSQMALFLQRLLEFIEVELPKTDDTTAFDDLDNVSVTTTNAINHITALGIMSGSGTTPGKFDPHKAVTRESMAVILARLLNVAGAQPVHLELNIPVSWLLAGNSTEATVTATKPNGDPYRGLLVDVFAYSSQRYIGICKLDNGTYLNGGDAGTSQDCTIDHSDPKTNAEGKLHIGLAHIAETATTRIYAWTGSLDQEFTNEVRTQASAPLSWGRPPTGVTITEPIEAIYGYKVTITASLTGPNAGYKRMVIVVKTAEGVQRMQQVRQTLSSGSVSFLIDTRTDPYGNRYGGPSVTESVLVFWDRNGNNIHDGAAEPSAQVELSWKRE